MSDLDLIKYNIQNLQMELEMHHKGIFDPIAIGKLTGLSKSLIAHHSHIKDDISKLSIRIKSMDISSLEGLTWVPFALSFENCKFNMTQLPIVEIPKIQFIKCIFVTPININLSANNGLCLDACTLPEKMHIRCINTDAKIINLVHNEETKSILEIIDAEVLHISDLQGNVNLKTSSRALCLQHIQAQELSHNGIRSIISEKMCLNDCTINKIIFRNVTFPDDTVFEDCKFIDSSFLDCNFTGYTSFKRTKFINAPLFVFNKDGSLFQNTNFMKCAFKEMSDKATGRYRHIKDLMARAQNELEEMRFASLEMRSRSKGLKLFSRDCFEKICAGFSLLMNDYGFSIGRPLAWLLILFLVGINIYIHCNGLFINTEVEYSEIYISNTWIGAILSSKYYLVQAAYFSFINTMGPLRLLLAENLIVARNLWIQSFVLAQNIASSILLYLLIIGIRKRFRQH